MLEFLFYSILYVLIFLYFILPLVVYFYPKIISRFIFSDILNFPPPSRLIHPENFGFSHQCFRNTLTPSYDGCHSLGTWTILSEELEPPQNVSDDEFETLVTSGCPVMLYYHGNSMNRGCGHRVDLYKLMRKWGFIVVTADYRGFGDSEGHLETELDILDDAHAIFSSVIRRVPESTPVFVWGHSLGTGVTGLLLRKLHESGKLARVSGVFLEAPFTSVVESMDTVFYCLPWRRLPYFNMVFKRCLPGLKMTFNSARNFSGIPIPILIMHAEDDFILDFSMGKQLFETLRDCNKQVFFKPYSGNCGYGHQRIQRDPGLSDMIMDFVRKCTQLKQHETPISDIQGVPHW